MFTLLLSLLWGLALPGQASRDIEFDVRARQNLMLGTGETTGADYYDVVITSLPRQGVLIKLPYTRKGGKFSFDLHHRLAITENFGLPAEVMTVVEVMSGGTNSLGSFTIADTVNAGDSFDENVIKTSTAEIDRYVTPMSRKTITLDIRPGPQSVSIVGQMLIITRGSTTTRIDTPGTRIATVSSFKFEEITETNPLKPSGELR